MNTSQICPPHLSDVVTLPREIQKKSFFNNVIHILQIIYVRLPQKKTNSNCCTASLPVYLGYCCWLLPIIFTALILRLGNATGRARVLIPHVEARGSGLLRHGLNFSTALYILWNELSRNSMHIYINTILKSRTARSTRTLKADGLSVCDHIFETTRLIFTKFLLMLPMAVARSSAGGVVNSDILCTSGFMDDVMFTHKPRLLDVAAQLKPNDLTILQANRTWDKPSALHKIFSKLDSRRPT